jgi:hypothetical protein
MPLQHRCTGINRTASARERLIGAFKIQRASTVAHFQVRLRVIRKHSEASVSGYTVTITPSRGQSGPQATIHVDTTGGTVRVTEFTVRPNGNGLSPGELPSIDYAGLVAALNPTPGGAAPSASSTPAKSRRRRDRQPATTKATAARVTRGRRRTADTKAAPNAARAYRRMPDQDEVVSAWVDSGSTSAVAAHFGVPRHTASGWLRRLRTMGVI